MSSLCWSHTDIASDLYCINISILKAVPSTSEGRVNLNYIFGISTIMWPVFSGVRVTRALVLYVMFFVDRCLSFCHFLLAIVLSVLLRFTDSDYPFGIFKLFLNCLIDPNLSHVISNYSTTNNYKLLKKKQQKTSTQIWMLEN